MKASNVWFLITTACLIAALITQSLGWCLALVFSLWRLDQADTQEDLKEIKELLRK